MAENYFDIKDYDNFGVDFRQDHYTRAKNDIYIGGKIPDNIGTFDWNSEASNLSLANNVDLTGGINQGTTGAMTNLGPNYMDNLDASQKTGGYDWGGIAKGAGSVMQGVGGLAQAWTGMQGLKLAKKQLEAQNAQWEKNYQAQRSDIAYDRGNRAAARSRQSSASVI